MESGTIAMITNSPIALIVIGIVAIIVMIEFRDVIKKVIKKKFGVKEEDVRSQICERHVEEMDKLKTMEIKVAVQKAREQERKLFQLKKIELVEAQMVLIERLAEKCKNILMDDFKELLDEDYADYYKECRAFDNILDKSFIPIIMKLKEFVVVNHLTERSEDKYRDYVDETADETIEAASASIDDNYMSEDFNIKRVELKRLNLDKSGKELHETVIDTLYELRTISKKYEDRIKVIEKEI